ncbi:MAG: type II toxin-antitoxin system RelE/ParE family toxin [Acidobacteria bacterium]|nr:type II toxin-antitoxin system RelE/ParE family toxin [Acidobacteriota bacterium]
MEVIFKTKRLEKCYLDHLQGRRAWGPEVGRKYIQRIDILQEAVDMAEVRKLPGLDCHPLKGGRKGQFGITLHGRWRQIFSLQGNKASIIRVEEVSKHYGD